MQVYPQFVKLSFLKMLAYRLRYYTGIFTYLVHVSVYWFIWEAVFSARDHIAGFNLSQMTSYVAVGWIARSFYFNNIDRDIHSRVLSGDIAIDLLRPVDFQLMHLSNALGESLFRLVLFAVPAGLVICLVYPVMPPVDSLALVGFAVATWLAFLINGQINFMIGLIAFKTRSVMGIMRVKHIAMQLLTGLIVPISFFPETLRTLLYLTPFPYIANVPLEVYLGKISSTQFYSAIGIQLMWIISLFFLGRLLWRNSLRALVIQGG